MTDEQLPERALTLRQPWAWLVANGHKPIENRPVRSSARSFRGPFWIHAGIWNVPRRLEEQWRICREMCDRYLGATFVLPPLKELTFGAIIGRATVTGSHPPAGQMFHTPNVPWHFPDQYGLMLENVSALTEPVPCLGALGFWKVPDDVLTELRRHRPATGGGT